jgi:serine/threonine protein kinase
VESLPLISTGAINLEKERAIHKYNTLRETFPKLRDEGLELLHALLTYDPNIRITAAAAANHEFFHVSPFPQVAELMPTFPSQHNEMMKQQQQQR